MSYQRLDKDFHNDSNQKVSSIRLTELLGENAYSSAPQSLTTERELEIATESDLLNTIFEVTII